MEIKRFAGIRNTTAEERFKLGELMSATDVELDNTGKILSRKGYTKVSAVGMRSVFNNGQMTLAAVGSSLVRINPDFSSTVLASLGSTTLPITYQPVGSDIYWSDGIQKGAVGPGGARDWGVEWPVGQPVATPNSFGDLQPGKYLYAMTFLRSDGHESGTGAAGLIELTSRGGITFTSMEASTNPLVSDKILYLSSVNGEVMYRVSKLPNAQDSVTLMANAGTIPLMTQFKGPPPAGNIVRYYNGCMYVVVGDTVYRSRPYDLELFEPDVDHYRFPGELAMFEPVNDGLYVATVDAPGDDAQSAGDTFYLAGADPAKSTKVFDHGAIPGTAIPSDAGFFLGFIQGDTEGMQGQTAVLWASRFGICIGFDGGQVENLTEAKYSLPTAQRGAAMVRHDRGFTQLVIALQGTGAVTNEYTRE